MYRGLRVLASPSRMLAGLLYLVVSDDFYVYEIKISSVLYISSQINHRYILLFQSFSWYALTFMALFAIGLIISKL